MAFLRVFCGEIITKKGSFKCITPISIFPAPHLKTPSISNSSIFSEGHEEVVASLLYFVQEKKSFALVCGDVGTGKTMIIHHLIGRLPRSVEPILIPYPDVEYIEILRYIARVLKINPEGKGRLDLTDDIKAVLTKASLDGRQVVLIVDEAHLLSIGSLEHIRLLSNIEMTENKLLQILLIGQNELSRTLHRREMRQLIQRINVNQFLSPMSPSETIEYVESSTPGGRVRLRRMF